jgi:polar amino acid transport system substrate-binding protein
MKRMKKVLALMLAIMLVGFSFAACSNSSDTEKAELTIAVEKGSAGEEEAKKLTNSVVSLSAQSDALKEVKAGTADACIIDSTMANSMTADGTDFDELGYTVKLTTEEYGIGFRQGSDVTAKVNAIIDELVADGTLAQLSEKYGVDLADNTEATDSEEATLNEYDDIIAKGKLVVGVTSYEPIDYQDADGTWIGFDADFARAVAEKMGVEVEFVEINWDNKFTELKSGAIDCIWNGMTISDSVKTNCSVSKAYAGNSQVVVMNKDKLADYPDAASLNSLD